MDCILLGIGATMPLFQRPLTAVAIRLNGVLYLFDGGEGVQMVCKRVHLGFRSISVIAISHLHADHCLGIPGILMMRARTEDPDPLTIIGPPGTERFIRDVWRDLSFYINYEIKFVELGNGHKAAGVGYEDDQLRIRWASMMHSVPCLGYRVEENERPGKFSIDKVMALGIPQGVLWGKLQKGEIVTLDNGVVIRPDQVVGPKRKGRTVAYITDTLANRNIELLISGADLAFIEGMFHSSDEEGAQEKMHLTAREAGKLCRRAKVAHAVLIHVSPRYEEGSLHLLEKEAEASFPWTEMGKSGHIYTVPLPD